MKTDICFFVYSVKPVKNTDSCFCFKYCNQKWKIWYLILVFSGQNKKNWNYSAMLIKKLKYENHIQCMWSDIVTISQTTKLKNKTLCLMSSLDF